MTTGEVRRAILKRHVVCLYRVTHGNLTSFEWVVLRTVPMCGFNKMVPQRTLQTSQ